MASRPILAVLVSFLLVIALGLGAPRAAQAQIGTECASCGVPYKVSVTPDGGSEPVRLNNTGGYTATFWVQNVGDSTDTYDLTCSQSTPVTCGTVTPPQVTLGSFVQATVTVNYSVGAAGTGTLKLWAEGNLVANDGSTNVTAVAPPTVSLVAPVLTTGSRSVVRTRQPLIRALITPNPTTVDSTLTVLKWRGSAVTSLARANRGLIEWEVDSTRWLAVGDSAQIEVTACSATVACTTVTRWAVLLNDNKPILGFSGVPLEALGRGFGAPFGPGISVAGGEVETGFGSLPYVSLGASRSFGLTYSTRQSYPRALVPVDLELPWPAGTPTQVKLILYDGVTKLDSLVLASPTCATGALKRCRAVLQGTLAPAVTPPRPASGSRWKRP
ncbi:MAG: hypothetical protein ACREMO_00160 [Gemmatimonadales bacterium]